MFFRQCSAAILQSVDNYAILCLDIVWCYLCLKNVDDLPDAGKYTLLQELYVCVWGRKVVQTIIKPGLVVQN